MTAHSAANDGAWDGGPIRTHFAAAPIFERSIFLEIERPTGGTGILRIEHTDARVISGAGPSHRSAVGISAADDRLACFAGLLEERHVGALGDGGRYAHAAIVHCLGTEGAGWEQTTDNAPIPRDRGHDRAKSVTLQQTTAITPADIVGDDHRPVVEPHHPRSRRQRHQHLAHDHSLNKEGDRRLVPSLSPSKSDVRVGDKAAAGAGVAFVGGSSRPRHRLEWFASDARELSFASGRPVVSRP